MSRYEPQVPYISFQTASKNGSAAPTTCNLIFFITGNPGLISYYNDFLRTLNDLLSLDFTSDSGQVHIYGQSLAGFEDATGPVPTTPYSLEEQIQHLQASLEKKRIPTGPRKGQAFDSVILMGHSVGSYILLELIQRSWKSTSQLNIKAGILLFPTITHISQSPSGVKINKLFRLPDFPRRASIAAKTLISLIPNAILIRLVRFVTGMPNAGADVTTRFLKSRIGIWQALHMAKDEMDTITEDKWDEGIWGIENEDTSEKSKAARLIFYFGQNDHWVADHRRDALIAARGQNHVSGSTSKPLMIIDQDGIPHGFCLSHSEVVAEKTSAWVKDILAT